MSDFEDAEKEARRHEVQPSAETPPPDVQEVDVEEAPEHGLRRLLSGIALIALVILAVLGVIGLSGYDLNGSSTTTVTATPSTSATPPSTPKTAPPNTACTSGLSVTYLDPHQGQDVGQGVDPNAPGDQKKKQILDESADPSVFAAIYNDSVFVKALHQPTITDPWSLVDKPHTLGACWTADGKALHDKWAVAWSLTDAQPVPLLASGSNGHVGADGAPGQSVGSIPSGHATRYTYRDADGKPVSDSTLRDECLNPINEAPVAGVPVVETPPSPPPSTETQPPCDTCCTSCDTTTTTPTTSTTPPCDTCCDTTTTCTTTTTTTTTPTTSTPPPCPPGTIPPMCLATKTPTTNPSKPPGQVPLTLDPRDTLQPTRPTLAPGTIRQTTPIPTAAPPSHLNTTPRSAPPPPPAAKLPSPSHAPSSTVITRPHM